MTGAYVDRSGSPEPASGVDKYAPSSGEAAWMMRRIADDLEKRYEVLGFVGQGGFATVWHARDRVTGEAVAIKRFEPGSRRPRDFYLEMSSLFRLQHPRIVRIINLREAPSGARYLMLEFCPGGNLRSALVQSRKAAEPLEEPRLHSLAAQMAEGLAAAHRHGLVHRDLKPENLLFDRKEAAVLTGGAAIKLADFGLARMLRHAALNTRSDGGLRPLSGSPTYMAPEQFCDQAGRTSDIYALGVILFELWHGRPPFLGAPGELAKQHLRQTPQLGDHVPDPWRELLLRMLAKEPEARPEAAEVADRLAQMATQSATRPVGASPRSTAVSMTVAERCLGVPAFDLFWQAHEGAKNVVAVAKEGLFRIRSHDGKLCGVTIQPGVEAVAQDTTGRLWLLQDQRLWRQRQQDRLEAIATLTGTYQRLAVVAGPNDFTAVAVQDDRRISVFQVAADATRLLWSVPASGSGPPALVGFLPHGELLVEQVAETPRLLVFGRDGALRGEVRLPGTCLQHVGGTTAEELFVLLNSPAGLSFGLIKWSELRWYPLAMPQPLRCLVRCPRTVAGVWAVASDGNLLHRKPDGNWNAVPSPLMSDALKVVGDGTGFAALVEKQGSIRIRLVKNVAPLAELSAP